MADTKISAETPATSPLGLALAGVQGGGNVKFDPTLLALVMMQPLNLTLVASVASNALTIAIKGFDGNDPSASNPVYVPFRSATPGSGDVDVLTLTSAQSLVVPNGATMGFASGQAGRLWVVGFNDGGTFRLGLVNCLSATSIMSLRNGIYSSTTIGTGSDSAHVIYSGTGVSAKALIVLGYLEATEASAGVWATAPSLVKAHQAGDALPGDVVSRYTSVDGAVASGTTTMPLDNTIPQNTEGNQFMSLSPVLRSLTNLVRIHHQACYTNTGTVYLIAAIFGASANALAANAGPYNGANYPVNIAVDYIGLPESLTPTYTVRAGGSAAGTIRFNGYNGAGVFGGVANGLLEVEEIMA